VLKFKKKSFLRQKVNKTNELTGTCQLRVARENNDLVLHDRASRALSQYYALYSLTQPYSTHA